MWTCSKCGETHDDLPLCFGAEAPDLYASIPDAERDARVKLDTDLCVIDQQYFFVLGRICIPMHGSKDPFVWLVWVSLSQQNYERTLALWETPGRESEPPYFGWLSTQLPVYPSTLNLRTSVHTMPVGERPTIVVRDDEHPLAHEQEQGISASRLQEIAEQLLHG
ncbi:MAG: DUF2199 domain-containing protein [Ktedonobacterales bacterium]